MAEFITKCPHCNVELQAQDEWIGMEVECPQCNNKFNIGKIDTSNTEEHQNSEHSDSDKISDTKFTFVCPACGSVEELSTELLGTNYECQACFEKNIATATTERLCPFCGETVKYHAVICKYCKKDLSKVPPSTPLIEKFFIFICPECDTVAELPESMLGKKYECTSCCESSIAKEAEERKCPACGEKIKIKATVCKHCKKSLKPLVVSKNQKVSLGNLFKRDASDSKINKSNSVPPISSHIQSPSPKNPPEISVSDGKFSILSTLGSAWSTFCKNFPAGVLLLFLYAIVYYMPNIFQSIMILLGQGISTLPITLVFCIVVQPISLAALLFAALWIRRNEFVSFKAIRTAIPVNQQTYLHFLWGYYRPGLIVLLWSLLLIIPGIIASMKYLFTLQVLLDDPELKVKDAMRKSAEITQGKKLKIFLLFFLIISVITVPQILLANIVDNVIIMNIISYIITTIMAPLVTLISAETYDRIRYS